MDLLTGNIRKTYFRYLTAAFGSTFIASIYAIVDMAVVGQYHGPDGSAALAVFAPFWNIIYSIGLMAGIGGSVLYGASRGKCDSTREANEYFTASLLCGGMLIVAAWIVIAMFHRPLLIFFGADETLLALAVRYLQPILFTLPFFAFNEMLAAFLRNDGHPGLATAAVLSGGVFNIFGDLFFVFALDMGISGAGLATAMGSFVTLVILLLHFVGKRNTLGLVKPQQLLRKLAAIIRNGFSTCIIDLAMGVMTILFNRQIMHYLNADALAVYGIIVNISTFVQCCAYSVGQASQPIISMNFGAGQHGRIRECLCYSLYTTTAFGIFWTLLSLAFPNLYVHVFMSPTPAVLEIAPDIIRAYSLSFLLLPFNVFSTYYFQATLQPAVSFIISIARGILISGALILLLPLLFGGASVWYAMLITETLVALYVVRALRKPL